LYSTKLKRIIGINRSHLIVGLDTDAEKIPKFFLKFRNPVLQFNKIIIESTKKLVAGYKFNMAFYESLGSTGYDALKNTLRLIPFEQIKICDAKRGDIENSDEMYAKAYFDNLDFDSITFNPYLGKDSIIPFIKRKDKLTYVLVLTSNKGHEDFQKSKIGKKYLYEKVIEKCIEWNKFKNIGFVIGANHINAIGKCTISYKNIPILVPGIGAQRNDLELLLKNLHSNLFLINSSRGIIYSAGTNSDKKVFIETVRRSTIALNEAINSHISN
jgi:orotidine-5'-phosphate decarboxylase